MSHILVSVLPEVAANCYFIEHYQFSTHPTLSFTVNFTQVQDKQLTGRIAVSYAEFKNSYYHQQIPRLPNKEMLSPYLYQH